MYVATAAASSIDSPSSFSISNAANGQDCTRIGTWNPDNLTCTLNTDVTFSNGTAGIYLNSDGVTLDGAGHTLTGNNTGGASGVFLPGRHGVTIRNLAVAHFDFGILLAYASSNNVLQGNNVSAGGSVGINIDFSSSNTLTGNTVRANSNTGINLGFSSNDNTLTGNNVSANGGVGIYVYSSNGNTFSDNTDSQNGLGIILVSANGNSIYHNNFLNNQSQAYEASGSVNAFNLSAPTGGNYWSNWASPDADANGFVDNAFVFAPGQDNLPLAQPVGCSKPSLSLTRDWACWASYADYVAGILSVDFSLGNGSPHTAYATQITMSSGSNGVTPSSSFPINAGNIAAGGSTAFTLEYNVPAGVSSFTATVNASAQDACGTVSVYP